MHKPLLFHSFLCVIFDNKSNFEDHIDFVRQKCEKALNLLKVVLEMDSVLDLSV